MTTPTPPSTGALAKQVGGDHYKGDTIQHVEYCQRNGIHWCESAAIKYIIRHRKKGGRQDIQKAIHYLELLLQIEYPEANVVHPELEPHGVIAMPVTICGNTHYQLTVVLMLRGDVAMGYRLPPGHPELNTVQLKALEVVVEDKYTLHSKFQCLAEGAFVPAL